jgi:hypothetical protein
MRKCLYLIAILIAIITFSCDTTDSSFEGAVPELFSLVTEVDPEGAGRVNPSEGEFVSGTRVELRAIPEDGYIFDRWGGALSGRTNPVSIEMSRDRAVMAYFIERDYPLTIEIVGEGSVTEEIVSQSIEETGSDTIDTGPLAPESREIPAEVDGTPDSNITTDDLRPQLNRESAGAGTIVSEIGTASQDQEPVTVRLTAEPAEGWYFDRWEGDLTGSENPAEIVIDQPKTVTAVFEQDLPDEFTLNIQIEGEGVVEADPDLESYEPGTEVELIAIPETGWNFLEWAGDLTGSENPAIVIMDDNKEITARFELPGAPVMDIIQQPSETVAGMPITPAPAIELTDDQGNPVENVNVTAVLNENSLASSATSTVATDENGVAAFDNLVIETAGTDYVLTFDADETGVSNVSSGSFDVIAAAPDPSNSSAEVPDGVAGQETVIIITVQDQFGNPVSGVASDIAVTVSGSNSASPEVTETESAGVYESAYTPLIIGTDNIDIELDGSPIDGSPYESNVTVSAISSSNSIVTADPAVLPIGNNSTVTVELRDEIDNLISGLAEADFSISVTGNATSGEINEPESGIYTFTVTNTLAETVTVTVTVNGVTLEDQPEITFESGDASSMTITQQPGGVQAGQPIEGPPAVRLTDSEGNPVPGATVNVSEQSGQSFDSGELSISTNENGVAVFDDLVITVAGRYNLVFSASGVSNLTSNAFNVTPAEADPENTEANVPNGSAGDSTEITITVRDGFDNRVEGIADDLTVTVSGGPNTGASVSSVIDEGDGIYTAGYTPVQTGDDEITIELGGVGIQGSPFTSSVITSDAEVMVIDQQPQQTIAGQPVEGPPAVEVVDDLGNPVNNVEVNVSISGNQSFSSGSTQQLTNNNGIAVFDDLVINSAGTYSLVFNAVGVSENLESDSFNVIAADPSAIQVVSGDNQTGTVGSTLSESIVVRVEDEFGNPIGGYTVDFDIEQVPSGATGQSLSQQSAETDETGTASTELTLGNRPGTYTVNANAGAAGTVVISASASAGPADSFEFDTISSPRTAGESFGINITALDEFENKADSYNGTAQLSTTAGSISPSSVSFNGGEASASVTVSEVGTGQTITATDSNITGTSNDFDVESGGVSASESSVSVDEATQTAGNSSTVTVLLHDGAGNPVTELANQDFDVSVSGDGNATAVTETGTAGTYTFDVTNETAETVTVTVTADGVALDDQPTITFVAGPGDPSNTTANVPDGTAGNLTTITITVLDQYDNPVSGAAGNLSVEVSGSNDASPSVSENGAAGEYTAAYTPTTAGSDQVAISLNGTPIADSPYTSTVTTSDISTSNSSVAADPTTLQVGGSSDITVEIRDDNNNLIGGLAGDINVSVSGNGTAGSVSEESSGIYEFTVSNNTAQTVTVTVVVDGVTLDDRPEITFEPAGVDAIAIQVQPGQSVAGEPIAGPPTVRLLDSNNNRVPGVDITVTEQSGQAVSGESTLTSNAQGEAVFDDISITQSGSFNLVFTASGATATSNSFIVDPGDVSASVSGVSATSPHTADGSDASEVTITLADANGNVISGLSDPDFTVDVGANAEAGSVSETSTNGTYEITVTNTTIETVTVTITVDGITLDDQPEIEFQAGDASDMNITVQPSATIAGTAISPAPTVEVTDGTNPVSGVDVTVSLNGADFSSGTLTQSTGSDGIAVFPNLVIETAGTGYTLTFDADAAGVADVESVEFDVITAEASAIEVVSGDNQSGTVGSLH